MNLTPRSSRGAHVTATANGWRLSIPAGDASAYRIAQLDDYARLPRGRFPSRPPLTLSLRARVSSDAIPGTWGFGWWNDPFGLSLGFGGSPFRLPSLPNALWFFHASKENWLSFKGGFSPGAQTFGVPTLRRSRDTSESEGTPGNGFLAQAFRAPRVPSPLLALAGLPALPLLATRWTRIFLRKVAGLIVREDAVRLGADQTLWHSYRLEWSPRRAVWEVDGERAFESRVSPRPPLGVVVWIDNQFAAFTPEGKIGYGVLAGEEAWLEIENLALTTG